MALITQKGVVRRGAIQVEELNELPKDPLPYPPATMTAERSKAYEAVRRVVEVHRASERYALWCARRTAIRFRDGGTRGLAKDKTVLEALASQFNIHVEHWALFGDVVKILCEMLPGTRAEADAELMNIWKRMELGNVDPTA